MEETHRDQDEKVRGRRRRRSRCAGDCSAGGAVRRKGKGSARSNFASAASRSSKRTFRRSSASSRTPIRPPSSATGARTAVVGPVLRGEAGVGRARCRSSDLAEFGLAARPDGSYVVDLRKFPQWEPLDDRLYRLTNPDVFESYESALRARGFRDSDMAALRSTWPLTIRVCACRQTAGNSSRLSRSGCRRAGEAGQPLNLEEVLAYRYQKASLKAEIERQWAVELLDALDPQRQRILASFLPMSSTRHSCSGRPTAPLDQTLEQEAQPIVSGEYVQMLSDRRGRDSRDVERRAEKLMEGEQR